MFVYGVQYLRGETPRMDQWEKDFKNMKKMGVNTIRVWLLWNRLEIREGVIDYDYLDKIFDLGDRYDIKIGCLFHLHAAPEWAICKYPQYYYVNAKGISFLPSPRNNTPSGGWPGLCYDNKEVQDITLNFIKRVVSHVKDRESLSFWEPMNEPHVFFDHLNNEEYCYCEATKNAFRKWLKEKYTSISVLNKTWGRRFIGFDQVFPPTWKMSYTDWIDWRTFTKDNLIAELKRRINTIKKLSNKPVIGHSYGGSQVQNNVLPAMAFDDWDNAHIMDKWGCSGFPSQYSDTVGVSLAVDATRNAGRNKEVWQSELGCGQLGTGINPRGEISEKQFAMWTWLSIAHGAKGVLYWQYRKERHGTEANSLGMVSIDGSKPNESGREFMKIAKILKENEDLFLNCKVPESEVAILFSPRSYAVYWCKNNNTTTIPYQCLLGYYNLFWEMNVPCDIIHELHCNKEDLYKYKLIVLPFPVALDNKIVEVLKDYIYKGGTVFSDPFLCAFDQNFWLDEKNIPGRGFDEIFGVSNKDVFRLSPERKVSVIMNGKKYQIGNSHFVEKYNHSGCKIIASFDDKSPAITINKHGKGKAIMCGINLGLSYSPAVRLADDEEGSLSSGLEKDLIHKVFNRILDITNVSKPLLNVPDGVCFRMLRGQKKEDILFLFNNTSRKICVSLEQKNSYKTAWDTLSNDRKNWINKSVKLNGYETKIFKLYK